MAFRVALTFDTEHPDRPHRPGGTEHVLAILDERACASTFFIQGRWAEAYPALARSIAEHGHLVGNHSHYHARMQLLTATGMATDIRAAEAAIRRLTGIDPRPWFRCPFGAGTNDPAVLGVLARTGYRETRWDVGAPDWQTRMTGPRLAGSIVDGVVRHGDGAVVLLHPWTRSTGWALPAIIDRLRVAGASFVLLDALG